MTQCRQHVDLCGNIVERITNTSLELQPIMMSGPTNDTQWIPRKMTEGPTRPLVNMRNETPSQYYKLSTMTLQDHSMNTIFDNRGIGYDLLPTPLQKLYCNHIYNHMNKKIMRTIHCVIYDYVQHQKWLGYRKLTVCAHPST